MQLILNKIDAQLEIIGTPGDYAYTAYDFLIEKEGMNHQLFDIYKIRSELGYADVVPLIKGLSEKLKRHLDKPPDFDSEIDADLKPHYDTEDELASLDRTYRNNLTNVKGLFKPYRHPYANPKYPKEIRDHRNG